MNTKQITCRPLPRVLRRGVQRFRTSAIVLVPEKDRLDDYDTSHCVLTVAAGSLLAWEAINHWPETFNPNCVTVNYHFGLAPYTKIPATKHISGQATSCIPKRPAAAADLLVWRAERPGMDGPLPLRKRAPE